MYHWLFVLTEWANGEDEGGPPVGGDWADVGRGGWRTRKRTLVTE